MLKKINLNWKSYVAKEMRSLMLEGCESELLEILSLLRWSKIRAQGKDLPLESLSLSVETLYGLKQLVEVAEQAQAIAKPKVESQPEPSPKNAQTPAKEGSFGALMKRLIVYLQAHYELRHNDLTDVIEIAAPVETELVYHPLTNRDLNTICIEAQIDGLDCWDKDVKRCLDSHFVEGYHPFDRYLNQLPEWDGVDRVEPLARRVSNQSLWVEGFHTWMLGMTAQWMQIQRPVEELEHGHSLAPILISVEQGWGKSTFCRKLLPKELRYYYTDQFDLFVPNSCMKKMAINGLINLDEFDHIPKSKQSDLKELIQEPVAQYKNGNSKTLTVAPRLASFIGTTNRRDVLLDNSGSRRFLCVELEHPIDNAAPIDYTQLYAQLKQELASGRQYWLTEDQEAAVQESNQQFKCASPEEDAFFNTFRFADKDELGAVKLTSSQIYTTISKAHPASLRGITQSRFAQYMAGTKHRVHTNHGNVYWVVKL